MISIRGVQLHDVMHWLAIPVVLQSTKDSRTVKHGGGQHVSEHHQGLGHGRGRHIEIMPAKENALRGRPAGRDAFETSLEMHSRPGRHH